ncbi:murein L,D-transpeptidase [Reyranella sp. CPCC 100927]|uniref:L,D-transpeptidase family protein n=1 Tax=Reyranella sp. CPCC 100927 TaxID=2599616 RepID=UPI0011B4E5C9|nr:L,D-transpeptidase family protein [Reyranella sp. CPCC 100927]TWT05701.1 L,D-transpeptidase family protein [Reyranella sp. CPCC 100927]
MLRAVLRRTWLHRTGVCGVLAISLLGGLAPAQAQGDAVIVALKDRIRAAIQTATDGSEPMLAALGKVYAEREHALLWLDGGRPTRRGKALLEALKSMQDEGLEPEDYDVSLIEKLLGSDAPADQARADFLMSRALILAGADVSSGRVNATAIDKDMSPVQRRPDYGALAREGLTASDPRDFIQSMAPAGTQYPALKKALAQWRERIKTETYTKVPRGDLLRPGNCDARVPLIRKRLSETEADVPKAAGDANCYDDGLVAAVKRFQEAHNLSVDGVVGPRFTASLNIPIEEKVQQIIVNLERRRWAPEAPGNRYLLINAADYSAVFVDDGRVAFRTKVIVGTAKDQTPEITSTMHSFQTNPYWTVPTSIAGEEYLPLLRRDPYALQKSNMKIFADWSSDTELDPGTVDWASVNPKAFPYRIRQEPGASNALGYIFFPFSNKYGIYVHDTSSRFLFTEGSRNFSHGCIRLQNPFAFIEAAVKGSSSVSRARVETLANSGQRANFGFPAPITIQVTYQTVFADDHGKIQFRDDIYGRDRKVFAAMRKTRMFERAK